MKIGIMQPYFLPYIGYFQLINAVDKYVIYDDVNFIKGGWINRNRILFNGGTLMINVPMQGASSFKKINEIQVGGHIEKLLPTINQAYKKAPYYQEVFPLIADILQYKEENLARFIANSIIMLAEYMQIKTEFILSSDLKKNNELIAQDKVLSICKILHASEYYNAIGGQELYDKLVFAKNNIELQFLKTKSINYNQFTSEFIPNLSIIDALMFNSIEDIHEMLNQYELV
jgi:hypothetical protein